MKRLDLNNLELYEYCDCGERLDSIDKIICYEGGIMEYEPVLCGESVCYEPVGFDGHGIKFLCKTCFEVLRNVNDSYIKKLLRKEVKYGK